jgi:hypothetical protein
VKEGRLKYTIDTITENGSTGLHLLSHPQKKRRETKKEKNQYHPLV